MADLREMLAEMAARADAATPGPWESDAEGRKRREDCYNVILVGPDDKPRTLLDSANSDLACISDESDEDGANYLDTGTMADFEWIAAARTEHPALVKFAQAINAADRNSGDYWSLDDSVKNALAQLRADLGAK